MKLALAPMATLSHAPLRALIHRYGDPDEYFSEMIHAPSFVAGGRFESWYVRSEPCPDRMVWQLTGSDEATIVRAAELLLSHGGIGIDLNMGCSAPDIARFGAGIAWMSKPLAEVSSLVSSVRRTTLVSGGQSPRLGVKLRLGETEDYPRLVEFCRMLADSGADIVTLHPRVRRDKYGRPARREFVGRLASDLSIPVYGNGDIRSAADALDFMERSPCAGLMVGRGAVRTPWIFGDIKRAEKARAENAGACDAGTGESSIGDIDHLEVARFFIDALLEGQPPEFWISRAHRFFFYYCENFSFAHHIKMKIQNAETTDAMLAELERYFDEVPQDRILARA
ncbi:MAG TPA: tRNA-dihydrouridine synthase family protein [Treponemataceae bacterium]|nr:tRNA-dihydrouridine synthase family protein [Treponemataceae bacterium]